MLYKFSKHPLDCGLLLDKDCELAKWTNVFRGVARNYHMGGLIITYKYFFFFFFLYPTTRDPHPHTIANSEIHTKQGRHLGREKRFWWVDVLCWQNAKRKKDRGKKKVWKSKFVQSWEMRKKKRESQIDKKATERN